MTEKADERGRVRIPRDLRDEYGDEFHIIELPHHVGLVPVDEDLPTELEEAVNERLKVKEDREERWYAVSEESPKNQEGGGRSGKIVGSTEVD